MALRRTVPTLAPFVMVFASSLLMSSLLASPARAAANEPEKRLFQGDSRRCRVYSLDQNVWRKLAPTEIPPLLKKGAPVTVVKAWKDRPDYVLWKGDHGRYALTETCFDTVATPGTLPNEPRSAPKPAPRRAKAPEYQGTFYSQVSLSSWQETLQLSGTTIFNNENGGDEVDVLTDSLGICPGIGYRKPFSPIWSWDVNACAFFGRASLDLSSNSASSGVSYDSKNNTVIGLQSSVGLLWNVAKSKHQLGIALPIIIRHSSWSAPVGASISPETALLTGIQLESRFYSKGNFCFDPKIIWLQTTHTLMWSLNFGVDL
jgi:hypothetical protein